MDGQPAPRETPSAVELSTPQKVIIIHGLTVVQSEVLSISGSVSQYAAP